MVADYDMGFRAPASAEVMTIDGGGFDGLPYHDFGSRFLRLTSPMQQGTDVKILQVKLKVMDRFDPGPIDGFFGPLTQRAVKDFQGYYGLLTDGIVGPDTFWVLGESTGPYLGGAPRFGSRTLSRGMRGGDVWIMQNRLNIAGETIVGAATGFFDANTTVAVRDFQSRYNLAVDGIVGPETTYNLKLRTWLGGRKLTSGTRGEDVRQLQRWLNSIFNNPALLAMDGFYGSLTMAAVRNFQAANGVPMTSQVDPATFNALGRYTDEIGLDSEGRIAYRRFDSVATKYAIRSIKPDSTGIIDVTALLVPIPGGPRWSPNRQYIAYIGNDKQLYVAQASGGVPPTALAGNVTDPAFTWSPDSSTLAVTRNVTEIHTIDRATSTDRFIVAGTDPVWFPTGTRIAFARPDALAIQAINTDGSGLTTLTSGAGPYHDLGMSPDGTRIVYTTPGASISMVKIFNIATGGTFATPPGPQGKDYCPIWSPDGKLIAYSATDFVSGLGFFGILRIVDNYGEFVFDIGDSACPSACRITWGPRSDRIAFLSGCPAGGTGTGTVYSVALFAGLEHEVVTGTANELADWSGFALL